MRILKGTLDLLILRTLEGGPRHGAAIAETLRRRSKLFIDVEEGTLYPALIRLRRRGLIETEWGRSEAGRKAKFNALTRDGRDTLEVLWEDWLDYVAAVEDVLEAPEGS